MTSVVELGIHLLWQDISIPEEMLYYIHCQPKLLVGMLLDFMCGVVAERPDLVEDAHLKIGDVPIPGLMSFAI